MQAPSQAISPPSRRVLPSWLESERERIVGIRHRCGNPPRHFALDHTIGRREHTPAPLGLRIGPEAKAVEDPRPLALHHDRAAVTDDREERLVDPPAVTGQSRPATDEELGQLCVECVGERVLERPGALLPAARIVHPIGAM